MDSKQLLNWASLIRDIGLIVGVPSLITIGIFFFKRQINILKAQIDALKASNEINEDIQQKHIDSLKAENKVLKETQYDRALSLLEAQKKLHQIEREELEHEIKKLISEKALLEKIIERVNAVYEKGVEATQQLIDDLVQKDYSQTVLLFGYSERYELLQALSLRLKEMGFMPKIKYQNLLNENYTETKILVEISRFVVVEISDLVVHNQLFAIVPHFIKPFVLIMKRGSGHYPFYEDLLKYHWVLPPVEYDDRDNLLEMTFSKIVIPAELKLGNLEDELSKTFSGPVNP